MIDTINLWHKLITIFLCSWFLGVRDFSSVELVACLCSGMSRALAGKTPLAGGGDLLAVSSLTCVVPSWDDSEVGLGYGLNWRTQTTSPHGLNLSEHGSCVPGRVGHTENQYVKGTRQKLQCLL